MHQLAEVSGELVCTHINDHERLRQCVRGVETIMNI